MDRYGNEEAAKNWRIVRVRVCVRALLIFLGIILIQMFAYMLCVAGMMIWSAFLGRDGGLVLSSLEEINDSGEFSIWLSLVSALLSMVWCGILYKRSDWREKHFDYRAAFGIKNTLSIACIGVGGCIVLTMFLTALASVIPQAFSAYNTMMEHLTDKGMTAAMVYVLLIGPLSEEFIFRGAILDRFYLAFPFFAANLLQAALFGMYHMNLIQGLYAFCLGFLLGMIRHALGSILASMTTHVLFNGTSYLLDFLFPDGQEMFLWQMVLLGLAGVLLLVLGLKHILVIYRQKEKKDFVQN